MINKPHREYWLHPERRVATLAWMNEMMLWIAVLPPLLMIVMGHLTFIANKSGGGLHVGMFLTAPGVFLTCVFTIAGRSLWRFRLPR